MAIFQFDAVTYDNTRTSGSLEAKNFAEAKEIVLAQYAYYIKLYRSGPAFLDFLHNDLGSGKMKPDDVAGFLLLLGEMLRAGMSIVESLVTLARSGDKATAALSRNLHLRMIEGDDLGQAFSYCRKQLGKDYGSYIRVGIEGGSIGTVLVNLSESITKEQAAKKQIMGALRYPAFLAIFTLAVSIFLFTNSVPKIVDALSSIFESEDTLPAMTKLAMRVSDFLLDNGLAIIIFVSILGGSLFYLARRPFNYQWHTLVTQIPVVGKIVANKNMATFFRSLGIGVAAGMPIAEAMYTAADGLDNRRIKTALVDAADMVKGDGASLTEALVECPFISGIEIPVTETGLRSGQTPKMSAFIANIKEIENEQAIKTLTGLINPIMLAIVATIVGCIMYAVYGPVFTVMQNMQA